MPLVPIHKTPLGSVSMRQEDHYKTQSSAYDRLLDNGPLTDRKITKYKAMGYFGGNGSGIVDPRLRLCEEVREKRNSVSRAKLRQRLLDEYK